MPEILPTGLSARTPEEDGSIIVHGEYRYEVIRIHKGAKKGTVLIEVEEQEHGGVSMGSLPDTERITIE
jgi:hypothetical protein